MDNKGNIVPKGIEEDIKQYLLDINTPHKNIKLMEALVGRRVTEEKSLICNSILKSRGYNYHTTDDMHHITIGYECPDCRYFTLRRLAYILTDNAYVLRDHKYLD
jgi:hypothetical protein